MKFVTLVSSFLVIWLFYWLFIIYRVVDIIAEIKPVTIEGAQMGHAGPIGLVKEFYITKISLGNTPGITKNSSPISRVYTGLTLSKFMLPMGDINRVKTVTFYALPPNASGKIIHFAATAGREKASGLRLVIDVFNYVLHSLIVLHVAIFIVFALLRDIYKRTKKGVDVTDEVNWVYNQSNLSKPIMFAFVLFFITLIL
ncbi:hypothetical protein CKK33_00485 [Mucilaginibacter sp. MD40]|uniref:hypothetical protein n=1 Tax=Mucilaginibacter sp. MD40 TaxID=2029590 RepID=UPI000BAC662C|nr:hypothetical protein [Mucilaginibacter sp. MD40]PAW92049.1 hypothetical protein CKK33_00485 [Mucilaginibacter sp. MD40]